VHQAALSGNRDILEALLEAGANVDGEDRDGATALHYAGRSEIVAALITAGADVHHEDRAGRTPGHRACERSDMSVVQVLLDSHADPSKIPYTIENRDEGGSAPQGFQLVDRATSKRYDELDQASPGLTARLIAPSTSNPSITNSDRKLVIGIVSTISPHMFVTVTEWSRARRSRLV
jgi:ankyrin repeat protein